MLLRAEKNIIKLGYIYNRPIREIYFYLLKLRKRKKKLQQVAYAEFRFIFVLRERKPRRQKAASYFSLGLFYKSTKICFYCECTQIKANLLQLRLSLWLKVVASTVRRKKIKWLLQAPHARTQFSIASLTMQPSLFIIIIKYSQSNIWKKTHCSV